MRLIASLLGARWRLWLALTVAGVIGVLGWRVYENIYDKGAQDAKQEQKEVDDEVSNKAFESRSDWRSCRDIGGMWRFAESECVAPEESGGH